MKARQLVFENAYFFIPGKGMKLLPAKWIQVINGKVTAVITVKKITPTVQYFRP